ncbi:MAG: uracil-xanthine permease [Oscillospiraceae bacterium]|nr:uracil-xanthine permease [Oscillospiraceae bacterium]
MNLTYGIKDKPKLGQTIIFAFQQLLAIIAATIAVPSIIGHGMSQTAALFGAGVGTLTYLLFTKFRSPVFLGSSFAFLGSMSAAFAGAVSLEAGYVGLIIGAGCAALVYVVFAALVKFCGVEWINKLMPPVVIGPTVAIIGLSLAGNAIGDLTGGAVSASNYVCIICGLVTLFVTMYFSVFGKKMARLIPFILGIVAGYIVSLIFTLIGTKTGNANLIVINFGLFETMKWVPDFTFVTALKGVKDVDGAYVATVAVAYIPVALVVFAEHLADHKNLSTIVGVDLLTEPGLHRTLLGDGIGSFMGSLFGGCPNTTYGESIATTAVSGNASVVTILTTAILAILISFFGPFATFLATIPGCVMGGVCMTLYGFIAVSGLKMIQNVDLNDNRNLMVVCVILVAGVGGLSVSFGKITLTTVACALILGILTNTMLKASKQEPNKDMPLQK